MLQLGGERAAYLKENYEAGLPTAKRSAAEGAGFTRRFPSAAVLANGRGPGTVRGMEHPHVPELRLLPRQRKPSPCGNSLTSRHTIFLDLSEWTPPQMVLGVSPALGQLSCRS